MIRMRWQPGPEEATSTPVVVSATRFRYRRRRHMPLVWFHGWRLRRDWRARPGALGLYTAVELTRPVTYSVSVWRSEDGLRGFLGAADHRGLMRDFKARLATSSSVVFRMERLVPEDAWREGIRRLSGS